MNDNEDNKTKTYGVTETDNTSIYGSTDSKNTSTYGENNGDNTATYSENNVESVKSQTHNLGNGDKIILKSITYEIIGIISEGTLEAIIYKIKDAIDSVLTLKLYHEFSDRTDEPNFDTLGRIKEINSPDILKLIDYGKYQNKYCYEISEFAKGGDLLSVKDFKTKYTAEFISNHIVPELFNGINKLHELKIVHCDLKPSNIFYKDEGQTDLIIGDYGSAKANDIEDESSDKIVTKIKGSEFYIAPEQKDGFISEKNDFYSMGMILLHLLYPEEICNDNNYCVINKTKSRSIKLRQYQNIKILEYNKTYGRINKLIEGLTLNIPNLRWSKIEVQKWINGENIEVLYNNNIQTNISPIKLGYTTISNDKEFIKYIESNTNWYETLFSDQATYSTVKLWMDSYRNVSDRIVFDNMIKHYQQFGKDYVKESLIRYFEPDREVRLESKIFSFFQSNNINSDIEQYIATIDNIWKFTTLDKIRFYLFQLEFSLRQIYSDKRFSHNKILLSGIIDKLYTAFGFPVKEEKDFSDYKTQIQSKINLQSVKLTNELLLKLFYTFNSSRTFRDKENNSLKTITDIGLYFAKNESLYNDPYIVTEKQKYFNDNNYKSLIALDYKTFIFEVFKNNAVSEIELTNLVIDKNRNFTIHYKYYKSLNDYLSSNSINKDFTSRSNEDLIYTHQKGFLVPVKSECNNFINTVCENHNISTLTNQNIAGISSRFSSLYWRKHFIIYFGQYLALVLLFPVIILFFLFLNHNISIGSDWKVFYPNGQYTATGTSSYIVSTNSNLRSQPTKSSNSIYVIPQNSEIQVLSKGYFDERSVEWYKVSYNGYEGYVNSNLCIASSQNNNTNNTNNNATVVMSNFVGKYTVESWSHVNGTYASAKVSYINTSMYSTLILNKNGNGTSYHQNGSTNSFTWSISTDNQLYLYYKDYTDTWKITSNNSGIITMENDVDNINLTLKKEE